MFGNGSTTPISSDLSITALIAASSPKKCQPPIRNKLETIFEQEVISETPRFCCQNSVSDDAPEEEEAKIEEAISKRGSSEKNPEETSDALRFAFENEEVKTKYAAKLQLLSLHKLPISNSFIQDYLSRLDVQDSIDQRKPTLVLTDLKVLLSLQNPKDFPEAPVVSLRRSLLSYDFAVLIRPHAHTFLHEISQLYNLVVYADDYSDNLQTLSSLIENDAGFFNFVFGYEQLLETKYKVRSVELLNKIGISEDNVVFIGCDVHSFRGFETLAIPVRNF